MKNYKLITVLILGMALGATIVAIMGSDSRSKSHLILKEHGEIVLTGGAMYYYPQFNEGHWVVEEQELEALNRLASAHDAVYIGH